MIKKNKRKNKNNQYQMKKETSLSTLQIFKHDKKYYE